MCIGGPALIYYVTPTEEELFSVSKPDRCIAFHQETPKI